MQTKISVALYALALAAAPATQAYEAGDVLLRGGIHYVSPKSDNHDTLEVQAAASLTASVEYFLQPQWAIDLLVAVPFKHAVELNGTEVASTRHLPPTLSLVWYPAVNGPWHPYVGAGLNYTIFFDEDTQGPIAGQKLKLDPSLGLAAVAGIDWDIDDRWGVALDVRYMDIDTDGTLDGASLGTFEIDPLAVGLSARYHFGGR
ncbi:OmpW family protein [Solimonas sp. SE-A11]|uniref:OmpW/AlkL family protein n=1 Tax=Solimonas sp. SE-A11 TaxID=3054954 RepID=UPI00259D0DD7|nr:OmpW family outer membrane protein [Solimonas sp. SE-A11]MDM4769109.1 OmpW family outer membrane protein [Solimonas sp. SE-A11]